MTSHLYFHSPYHVFLAIIFIPHLAYLKHSLKQQNKRNPSTCVNIQLTNKLIIFADLFQLVQIKMQGHAKSRVL